MDKRVIFAVAGSGKTTCIIDKLSLDERSIIITYTNNNLRNLRSGIVRKFGFFPKNITLLTYFTFIYSFCFRPYLSLKFKSRGICFDHNPNMYFKQSDINYFFDKSKRIYSNRIAKLIEIQGVIDSIKSRITKYYDNLFIDEVQDLAGHDFNFLKSILTTNLNILLVGDFFQHTFDTSRDGNVNNNLYDDFDRYKRFFIDNGVSIDEESLKKSYRCSPSICSFVSEKLGIQIQSNRADNTNIVIVESQGLADEIFQNNKIVKLFFNKHYLYSCFSRNWGECKGENGYSDVCVVLNKTTLSKFPHKLAELPSSTKNKLYVACTRARGDLYFISEMLLQKNKIDS